MSLRDPINSCPSRPYGIHRACATLSSPLVASCRARATKATLVRAHLIRDHAVDKTDRAEATPNKSTGRESREKGHSPLSLRCLRWIFDFTLNYSEIPSFDKSDSCHFSFSCLFFSFVCDWSVDSDDFCRFWNLFLFLCLSWNRFFFLFNKFYLFVSLNAFEPYLEVLNCIYLFIYLSSKDQWSMLFIYFCSFYSFVYLSHPLCLVSISTNIIYLFNCFYSF